MEADFSVELGPDDDALELPWRGEGEVQYHNVKRHPELLAKVPEAKQYPELRDFLLFVNSPATPLETAKCDVWDSREITPDEELFGASCKFASYVDVLFSDERRFSFEDHEQFSRKAVSLLARVPEIPASAELIIRRCYFHVDTEHDRSRDGFYITCYLFGFGDDEEQAKQRWAIALKLLENALRQLLAEPSS